MPTARTFLLLSLGAHLAVGAALLGRAAPPRGATPPPRVLEPEALFRGDTFEVPVESLAGIPSVTPTSPATGTTTPSAIATPIAGKGPARNGGGESSEGTTFGATTDRTSIDLATAFTRGFPQAASADPLWVTAPFGPAGSATVVLEIDESGALLSSRIEGSPSPALRRGVERTLALIQARAFTATHLVTRLHVSASVSADEVHDGLHGEVFAIGGSFEKATGSAFFALAIGRRVDLRVRE